MITSPFLAAMVGMPELLIIGGILVLLFGATKLPQLAKGLGQSIKEFKKATKEEDETKPVPGAPKTDSVRSGSPGAN